MKSFRYFLFLLTLISHAILAGAEDFEELGFFEIKKKSKHDEILADLISGEFNKTGREYKLVVKIYCISAGATLQTYYTGLDIIKWSIDDDNGSANLSGSTQVGRMGNVEIRINSKLDLYNKTMLIQIKNEKRKISLGSGPYILNVSQSTCRRG